MTNKLLELKGIHKKFPGVYALKNVSFDLNPGEVHALIGENGAGKSTMVKIIAGAYDYQEGYYYMNGDIVTTTNTSDAINRGINVIYQELNVVPTLSVAENIFFGNLPTTKFGRVKWDELYANTDKALKSVGLNISPRRKVEHLKVAQQQLVEIAKAVTNNAKVVIMDEPTSALSPKEIDYLFNVIEDLKEKGVAIIYVSHKLDEILEISDRVTVLRDGQYVGTENTKDLDEAKMIKMMVGRTLNELIPKYESNIGENRLIVDNLSTIHVKNVSFSVKTGEIVGFSGLMGAGRTELANAIYGIDKRITGDIILDGKKLPKDSSYKARLNGIGLIPEDRKVDGIFAEQTILENMTLASLEQFIKFTHINSRMEKESASKMVDSLMIKTPSLEQLISKLSGGNQQKVIIARWLLNENLKVLIVDEPTRGIDVGAKAEIYELLNQLASKGLSIIMMSSEMPEIIGLCDRVYVMKQGRISGELSRKELTQEKLLHLAI